MLFKHLNSSVIILNGFLVQKNSLKSINFAINLRMSSDFASMNSFFLNKNPLKNVIFKSFSSISKDIRAHYGDPSQSFDLKDLASRDPFKQFDAWFQTARQNKDIKEAVSLFF
jgi:hypothetical protein